ncbi:ER membrane protein complex subunit 7-like [Dreissena polymorpha]|uniref:ER membrane protein complex subunit 7 beta-sandwich domain-containing protein n=1 Tax=Dreissena polymorpha TaxID=45954 RepID=A0A9D4KQ05_DREPO|nr:ER membrane protein complex subunit 7-like [Dreissena polymorpha]KAH3843026.1 hypothetical protein DPMN_116533 [Dreissena polymorpha]
MSFTWIVIILVQILGVWTETDEPNGTDLFTIEGKVEVVSTTNKDWLPDTQISVDGGTFISYLRGDGRFVISGVPSGTYMVEVVNPNYMFEPVRVDISAKGKKRARKINLMELSPIKTVHYPLEFRERRKPNYFQKREQWKITDFLFNPMFLTMVLPLVLVMILPKMMNAADPEAQKEMQSQMKALNDRSSMPDFSETLTSWLGGGSNKKNRKDKTK